MHQALDGDGAMNTLFPGGLAAIWDPEVGLTSAHQINASFLLLGFIQYMIESFLDNGVLFPDGLAAVEDSEVPPEARKGGTLRSWFLDKWGDV